jgi:predicted ATPase
VAVPIRLTSIIGRAEVIDDLVMRVRGCRFVTVVGTGGIGKTTVAVAAAEALAASFDDGVVFVDLSPLPDADLVDGAVMSALGLPANEGALPGGIERQLRDRRLLLVLDSCEHVLAQAARMVQAVLDNAPGVAVLATSREPLHGRGECVRQLPPMRLPPNGDGMSTADALAFPAIELFVERARAAQADFQLSDAEIGLVAALCRRLDGIPLAIEIVAARIAELGVHGLAQQVERRGLELTSKRRTRPPRHHTLSALLDWSYDALSEHQRIAFQRLSTFRATFTAGAAHAVIADGDIDGAQADVLLHDLAAKSLVTTKMDDRGIRYRLLEVTRTYAMRKLDASGNRPVLLARHAQCLIGVLDAAEPDWDRMARCDWLACYAPWIDDVRGAIDWAFSADGDASIGIALTMASLALVRQMGLDAEFRMRIEQAFGMLTGLTAPAASTASGSPVEAIRSRDARLFAALERITSHESSALATKHRVAFASGLWISTLMRADFLAAARLSLRVGRTVRMRSDPVATSIAMRMCAQSLHFLGHHGTAARLARHLMGEAPHKIPLGYNPSPIDVRVWMRIILARILWLQGLSDQAHALAAECVARAQANGDLAQCQALALAAIPIALWTGRDSVGGGLLVQMQAITSRLCAAQWQPWTDRYRDVLAHSDDGQVANQRDATVATRPREPDDNLQDHLCTIDPRWVTGRDVERVDSGMVGWCAPEILRAHGERLLALRTDAAAAEGEALLQRSLALARRQRALAWQLRTSTSLARLRRSQGRWQEALDLLAPVHARFTEGLDTPDGMAAAVLLAELRNAA